MNWIPVHFFHVTSDWGRLGPLWWTNSHTVPHRDPCSMRTCIQWGCVVFRPDRATRYSEVVYLD